MGVDVRREMKYIWRQYEKFYSTIGEVCIWFPFDTEASRYDDVYDEGGKTYLPGIRMPMLWVDQIEDPEQYTSEGRRPTMRIRFAVSAKMMRERGILTYDAHGGGVFPTPVSAPNPAQIGRDYPVWLDDRLNDALFYDGRFYAISNFQIRGRTPQGEVIVGVAGLEMQMDEFNLDLFPWNTPYGDLNAKPDVDYEHIDLTLFRSQTETYSLILEVGADLSSSTWQAKIFDRRGNVAANLTVNTAEQDDGILQIDIPTSVVLPLSVSASEYTWSLVQVFADEEPNTVAKGVVEVRL